MTKDKELYYGDEDEPLRVQTNTLNDELGQVSAFAIHSCREATGCRCLILMCKIYCIHNFLYYVVFRFLMYLVIKPAH